MKVLALEPFYSGSHRQFLDGWASRSQHQWTVLGLPGNKWKWRMRHAPLSFANDVNRRVALGEQWDVIFCSDMLNLGEFLALTPRSTRNLPSVVYFHENQFTYPNRTDSERDFHYAFTNYVTALTANEVWFNSSFHREDFLGALESFLRRMPDNRDLQNVAAIRDKSKVHYPGVCIPPLERSGSGRDATILWVSRWEHDKNAKDFFDALRLLVKDRIDFRINVLGESYGEAPPVFDQAKAEFADRIEHWGYVHDRNEYFKVLSESDFVVSTAIHEFFGIAVVEAMSSGAYPILPNRLSYPELLARSQDSLRKHLYTETVFDLHQLLADSISQNRVWDVTSLNRFRWLERVPSMDADLEAVAIRAT
ncbi:MAG: DUF3524 domain-containing protein [Planctomycetales bacterium]|nr:DUF3524 domain-containing protein [Planctomycetales bacterium]